MPSVDGSTHTYTVTGELFFASSNDLYFPFDYNDRAERIVIDLSAAYLWDASTVAALDAITTKFGRHGKTVEIIGMDEHSAARHRSSDVAILAGSDRAARTLGGPMRAREFDPDDAAMQFIEILVNVAALGRSRIRGSRGGWVSSEHLAATTRPLGQLLPSRFRQRDARDWGRCM